jgi:hypothetical protein
VLHALSCVPQLRTSPFYRGGFRCCHVSYGSGPHLPIGEGSGTAMCRAAPDPTSPLRRVLALSCAHGSGPRLPAEEGSDAATRLVVLCGLRASSVKEVAAGPDAHLRLARSHGARVPVPQWQVRGARA